MDKYFFDAPQAVHPERLRTLKFLEDNNYKDKVVLDIGCGIRKTTPKSIGIDIQPVTDICCSGEDLCFLDNSIDLIVSRHSFEHLLNSVKSLKDWIRVLKPGGKMFIVLPDQATINTMDPTYSGENYCHMHAYTQESFLDFILMFSQLRVEGMGVVVPNWSFCFTLEKIKFL